MSSALESLVWLILVTLTMLLLKRWIHRHVQGLGLLLTRSPDYAFFFYSLLLFPGTVVHETAHFLAAIFLDVHVRRFSLVPARQPRGLLRLGFVEIDATDTVREALIGLAPLIAGTAVVLLLTPRELPALQDTRTLTLQMGDLLAGLPRALAVPDFWLLLYLIFAVSNGMLPSESDRQAWKPILIWLAVIGVALYVSGLVTSIPDVLDYGVALAVRWIVRAFVLAILVDIFFVPIIFVLEKTVETLTRQHIRYE
jgi:hypothetical protein